jgi:glutamate-5-semialdehyde dehydrogenase
MNSIGVKSRRAAEKKIDIDTKNKVLNLYAKLLDKENKSILRENSKDIKFAEKKGIKENLINRLRIDEVKLKNIKNSIIKISKLKDPVNVTLKKWSRPNGLNIKRVTIPIGVIGVIFESRPNVTSDVAGLCFKSGNAVILKGGSEAIITNRILATLFRLALKQTYVD